MNRVIWLAPGEPMCSGSVCTNPIQCARRLITYTTGRPLADFSRYGPAESGGALCVSPKWVKHVSLADAVAPPAVPVIKEWARPS